MRYTHAHGIDEPLAVWGGGSGLYGVVPHLSWRGGYEAGSNIETGALLDDGGTPAWIWPARYRDLNLAPDMRAPNPEPTRWLGSLIEGQVDLSGLAYRRNRYYNPATGRFTQEDPIGLAGGLNLYGFAEGDPVNLSDPFGLWPCCVEASAFSMASRALAFEALLQQSVNLALGVVGGMTRVEKVIRFSQRSISAVFRHGEFAGKKVEDVAAGVRSGEISPDRLPVNVVELLGERYSMNNRSLTALRLGGKEPSVVRDVTSDPAFMRQLMERLKELGTARTDALPRIRRRQ